MQFPFIGSELHKKIVFYIGNLSAFLFFSLLLPTPSGHSVAIVLALFASLLSIPLWIKKPIAKDVKYALIFFLLLGIFWSHTFDDIFAISLKGDYLLRYFLGALFIIAFSEIKIHPRSIVWGMAVGCVASGLLAIYQYQTIGRAEGFTNAVRYGNMALLMFLICFTASFINYFDKKERILLFFCSIFGLITSILSLSRGGWLVLLVLPFLIFYVINGKKKNIFYFIVAFLPILFIFSSLPPVKDRILLVGMEVSGYFDDKEKFVHTSVGARLEQWKTAILMGAEKPLTGWGDAGIEEGKLKYIESSISDPSIMNFRHAHNDLLENWARRGAIGVIALIFIYIVPVYLLYLLYRKNKDSRGEMRELNKFLFVSGTSIFIAYSIFGLASVFFTFVISHNFYMFSLIFIFSSMYWFNSAQKTNLK